MSDTILIVILLAISVFNLIIFSLFTALSLKMHGIAKDLFLELEKKGFFK